MYLSALIKIIENWHYLFHRYLRVVTMKKINIHIVNAQHSQACFKILCKLFPAKTAFVHMTHFRVTALCGNTNFITIVSGFEPSAYYSLAGIVTILQPVAVNSCGIDTPAAKLYIFVEKLKIHIVTIVSLKTCRTKSQGRDFHFISVVFQHIAYHVLFPLGIQFPILFIITMSSNILLYHIKRTFSTEFC